VRGTLFCREGKQFSNIHRDPRKAFSFIQVASAWQSIAVITWHFSDLRVTYLDKTSKLNATIS
ncbi:MAG: hypothetical protein ACTHV7_14630, partial [Oleiphilaceae bacterium]